MPTDRHGHHYVAGGSLHDVQVWPGGLEEWLVFLGVERLEVRPYRQRPKQIGRYLPHSLVKTHAQHTCLSKMLPTCSQERGDEDGTKRKRTIFTSSGKTCSGNVFLQLLT